MLLSEWHKELQQRKGTRNNILAQQNRAQEAVNDLAILAQHCEQAQAVVLTVAQETQAQLEYRISELVSLAMYSVFDNPYEFELEFVQRRGRTECDIWFVRNGQRIKPLDASGGGAVDVACFALRIALWNLAIPKTAPVIICDETLKFLKGGDLPEKGAQMMKELADRLGVQIIGISHIPEQIEGSDKQINVTLKRGVSCVN